MKKILLFILHLGKILVPVFSSSQQRFWVQILFLALSLLVLICLAVSDIYWLLHIGMEDFLFNMNDFVIEGFTYIVMATAMVYIFLDTVNDSRKLKDQGKRYGFELLISKLLYSPPLVAVIISTLFSQWNCFLVQLPPSRSL